MRTRFTIGLALLLCAGTALADRQTGWDFGGELLYQFSLDVDFEGGSKADLDDDLGLALSFTYRFNSRLELLFGLDWNSYDYSADIAPAPTSPAGAPRRSNARRTAKEACARRAARARPPPS